MIRLFVYIIQESFPLENELLAGRKAEEWLEIGLADLPREKVLTLPKKEIADARYVAAVYPSCPLLTKEYLLSCLAEMEKRGISALDLGKGKIAARECFLSPAKIALQDPVLLPLSEGENRAKTEKALYLRIAQKLAKEGAVIQDETLVQIDADCRIEKSAVIEPFVRLQNTTVKAGAVIRSFSSLSGSVVSEGAIVEQSRVQDSVIGRGATVGPFAFVRAGSAIGENCRIGDFVEIKRSFVADGAKAAHLTYVGDAEIGVGTNLGCGTVFANYDGKKKHKTKVGNNAFIGANVNLVAPVSIGDEAFIAAGTTVTEDVPEKAFVIGRKRAELKQRKNKEKENE